MNRKTIALTAEQYREISSTMKQGFTGCRPNDRAAMALMLEANLGLRISDIVNLHFSDIIKDGERYRLSIIEQKTGKARTFTVPLALYQFMRCYCLDHDIAPDALIFPITTRAIQKQLKFVAGEICFQRFDGDQILLPHPDTGNTPTSQQRADGRLCQAGLRVLAFEPGRRFPNRSCV